MFLAKLSLPNEAIQNFALYLQEKMPDKMGKLLRSLFDYALQQQSG